MKKSIFVLFALASSVIVASSQTGVRFSIFANPTINWFQSDNSKNITSDGSTVGFDAGLTVDNYFADNYAFTTGISIGNQGGKLNYKTDTEFKLNSGEVVTLPANNSVKYKLQYLTIPAGLKFKTKEIGYSTFFAHLGLTSQINIKARAFSSESNNPSLDNDNVKPVINLFNMGYHIGAGVQYSLGGNSALVGGLTYTNGFIDITDNDKSYINSMSLALRVGILF